ncbi:HAMP domain-containing protein [Cellulomonas sp. APG4]|nr:sensor histidine kinase [Cellulomonas sp. APG4]NCT92068.1 HAMP domain-containing protein [Cellulomonas sp. APG4]
MTSPVTDGTGAPGEGRAPVSLRRRVDLAVASALVLVVLALAVAAGAVLSARERQHEVLTVYYEAITQTDTAYVRLLDAETAVRGFLLTGDEVTLEPLERMLDAPDPGVDVTTLVEDHFGPDSAEVRTREEAADAARAWLQDWAQPAIATVRAEGPESVPAAEVERGRALFDEVRRPVEEHTRLLKEGRLAAVAELRAVTNVLVATVVVLAVLVVAGGALLWVYLRRWITGPLDSLVGDVRVVADGDLAHPVREVGAGEVHEVSGVVEDMRRALVRTIDDAHRARVALEESEAQLRTQADDLARSNRDLEQFAYVASHDLQEPLRKVASFTQLLAKRYEGQLDERADQYIGFAVDGAKRMQRLINDLLGFSRVGRIGGEVTDVDMSAALASATSDLERRIEETGATVTAGELPVVPAEEPLVVQLLANLISNALKFRHPDRPPHVRLEAHRSGEVWEFALSDNGIGIDPQYAERVFVIFQRLHAKEVYEGTGIGLALCKKIVEYHGGDIWIDEAAVEGTTVRWTLPVAGPGGSTPPAGEAAPGPDADAEEAGEPEAVALTWRDTLSVEQDDGPSRPQDV